MILKQSMSDIQMRLAGIGVQINPSKSELIHFSRRYSDQLCKLLLLPTVRTTSAEGSSGEGLRRDAQNTSQATTRE